MSVIPSKTLCAIYRNDYGSTRKCSQHSQWTKIRHAVRLDTLRAVGDNVQNAQASGLRALTKRRTIVTTNPTTPEEQTPAAVEAGIASATPVTCDFGRMDETGAIYVRDGETERLIGGYPADEVPEDPFALYVRRFEDLAAQVKLFEDRLSSLSPKDIDTTVASLREAVKEPAALGDIPALRARVEELAAAGEERKEVARAERKAAKEEALAVRTALVERAEELNAQPLERIHWKQSGQKLREMLDEWKSLQRKGPRLDKSVEDELWKRFSAARTTFDRNRRQFFAALDQTQAAARATKEAIIAEAEELSTSTDWARTSAAFRGLMDRWKAAPRTNRKDDDALWARFRAAQQVFFEARRAKDQAADEEFRANLAAKEALLVEAEALLPVTDVEAVKPLLHNIQDRWDAIGFVPNADRGRIEARMRAVEDAVREAQDAAWRRSDPETQARANGLIGQLEAQLEELNAQLEAAEAAGEGKKAKDLAETVATKQAWLDQIRSTIG